MAGLVFPHLICDKAVECAPKTCNVASGVETIAVSPAVSISVIGLIIDASIPAGARNTAVAETRRGSERREGGEGEQGKEGTLSVMVALVSP